ncbi:MAG TPA: hypothetical protein DEB40_06780 [Elusimicrobia bacterium]|nr:hypothetical protein [Elusimicrobiota bacterium]HBT61432.1 hypothetical protein [Elusimicrobiota bacterium]
MDPQVPQRRSLGAGALAVVVIAGSAIGVMIYQLRQPDKPSADASGFDLNRTQEYSRDRSKAASMPVQTQSGLAMVQSGGMGKMRFGEGGRSSQEAPKSAAQSFTAAVRNAEAKARAFALAYTRRCPAIAQYGKDWMKSPELRKLNNDYMRDHDPINFLRGLAKSKDFGKLVAKYATNPDIHSFVKDGIRQAPAELLSSAADLLKEDGIIKGLISNTASAMGLPPALTAGMFGAGQVDQNQILGQILQGNPQLQKTLQNPDPNRGR